mmetsp:Transcript_33114/g.83782  ORF Transcript_33114/g.83782 Transcript_33114/m.83782 type:complete len:268 (-) Transcript_33114:242-1045(-)
MAWDLVLHAGLFAGVAGVLAHVADVLTCFAAHPELEPLFSVPSDILDFDKASAMMARKALWELALGHILALICIPAGFAGSYLIFHVVRPRFHRLRWPLVVMLFCFYVSGALMHCTFTFVGLMASTQPQFAGSELAAKVRPFFEIICSLVGQVGMLPGSVAVFLVFASGATTLPRWTCFACPGLIQLLVELAAQRTPFALRMYLLVTIYNLSSGIWHLTLAFAYYRTRGCGSSCATSRELGRQQGAMGRTEARRAVKQGCSPRCKEA